MNNYTLLSNYCIKKMIKMDFIKCGGHSHALLKEEFIVFVKILNKNFDKLVISTTKGLELTKWVNYGPKMPKQIRKNRKTVFNIDSFHNPNLAVFQFKQKTVEAIDTFEIKVKAVKEDIVLDEDIFYPIIKVPEIEVLISKRNPQTMTKGFLDIQMNCTNKFIFTVKTIDLELYERNTGDIIPITKHEMPIDEFFSLIEKLPPEINPDHYLGRLEIPKGKDVDIIVSIEAYDLNDNQFNFKSNRLQLMESELEEFSINPFKIPKLLATACI